MCSEPKGSPGVSADAECCCCEPGTFSRRFVSSKEAEERLEAYKDQLKKEIAGVDERIRKLKGE
jgi:hypothetical protein